MSLTAQADRINDVRRGATNACDAAFGRWSDAVAHRVRRDHLAPLMIELSVFERALREGDQRIRAIDNLLR